MMANRISQKMWQFPDPIFDPPDIFFDFVFVFFFGFLCGEKRYWLEKMPSALI